MPTASKDVPYFGSSQILALSCPNQSANLHLISAIPGKQGTIGSSCLFDAAKKTALTYKWKADNKAPFKQIGFVIVNFKVRQ